MKTKISTSPWPVRVPCRWLQVVLALLLLGTANFARAVTVNTLGGGNPSVSPPYQGYKDGTTLSTALFRTPMGITYDDYYDCLYVADRDNNAIRMLDLAGGQTFTIFPNTNTGVPTNLISRPVDVQADPYGSIFVLNRGGNGVGYSTNGTVMQFDSTYFTVVATNATKLTNAAGMALDYAGNIYVTVRSNSVIRIAPDGTITNIATINIAGTSLKGIVVKHNGQLAVCDAGRHGIYLINTTNGLVTTNSGFNGQGDYTGINNRGAIGSLVKYYQPSSVVEAGDGSLVVVDAGNHRVKVVTTAGAVTNLYGVTSSYWDGTYLGWKDGTVNPTDSFKPNVQSRMPSNIAIASDGSLYGTEDYYHTIRRATGTGLIPPLPPPPAAPEILTITANYVTQNKGQVNLEWTPLTSATNYIVKRSQSSGLEVPIANTGTATSYADTNVINGNIYYYVVSAANASGQGPNSAEVNVNVPLPPVPDPQIGYVDFPATATPNPYTSVFHPVSSYIFNNDAPPYIVIVGSAGSQTYYNLGSTLTNNTPTNGIADPTAFSPSAPSGYEDGLSESQVASLAIGQVLPDMTIRAIGEKNDGSPNSSITQARFQFVTANPSINGGNAADFTISDITAGARLYYTLDGSAPSSTNANAVDLGTVPSPTNAWKIKLSIQTNTLFKVRAFRNNYQPSAIVATIFTTAAFQPTTITFGTTAGNEPRSAFLTRPGQFYYAPVTLQLTPNFDKMYSLQFNITVTNGLVNTNTSVRPPAVQNGDGINFFSMLMTQVKPEEGRYFPPADGQWYLPIPNVTAAPFGGVTNTASTIFTNFSNNLLGVGWLYRKGIKYLGTDTNTGVVLLDFDTTKQDLITYSIAHDTIFSKSGGTVVVGAYSFHVPTNASFGDKYFIQMGSPSATSDGVGSPGSEIPIAAPTTNQAVTVGSPMYLVGDAAPFHWLNSGDFGNTNLDNSDVMQVYQSAVFAINMPPANSDLYLAMDSSGGFGAFDSINNYYTNSGPANPAQQQAMWDGNDLTVNTNAFGDGVLDINDLYVTYRRSLDPSLTWFNRYWTNNQFVAVTTPNLAYNINIPHLAATPAPAIIAKTVGGGDYHQSSINFSAGDVTGSSGQTISIPINAKIFGSYPLRVLGLNLTVVPLDGSPAITNQVTFSPVAALGSPAITMSKGAVNYSAAWLNSGISGLTGDVQIGTLTVKIPANATSLSAYAVHFDKVSGSPNGLAIFPDQTLTGLVTLSSRSSSTYGDGLSDSWRLRWFGTVNNELSRSNNCPSGDGISNWKKFVAGVDPNTANNFPSVKAKSPVPNGYTRAIHWPTVSGKQYVIERSTSLFPGTWTIIQTNTGTGTDMEFDDTVKGGTHFYRVRILP